MQIYPVTVNGFENGVSPMESAYFSGRSGGGKNSFPENFFF